MASTAQYSIQKWILKNKNNYGKATYRGVACGLFNIEDGAPLESPEQAYFYNNVEVNSNTVGNTLVVKTAFVSEDTSSIDISLEDAVFKVTLNISGTGITFEGETHAIDTSNFNDYWITLKGNTYRLFINGDLIFTGTATVATISSQFTVGYQNYTAGFSKTYIKYLKVSQGAKRPLNLSNMDFLLEVDTVDTFDSINLRSYRYNPADNTIIICNEDAGVTGTALGDKLVRSFTFPLLQRQDNQNIYYFYRVKIDSPEYASDWGYALFDQPLNPLLISTKEVITKVDVSNLPDKLVLFCYEDRKSYMLLKSAPDLIIDGETILKVFQNINARWKQVSHSYFYLDANITSQIFDTVFNFRMPNEAVYSKYDKSGNIASLIYSESAVIDLINLENINLFRNLNIHTAKDSVLYDNFGKGFGLTAELFNNINEYRDALLFINTLYCDPGVYNPIVEYFDLITGATPRIDEYKDKSTWVIWGENEARTRPQNELFILPDDNYPYSNRALTVLYSEEGKAYSWDLSIANPYGISLNTTMVRQVVNSYKPISTSCNIIFYNQAGREVQYPGEYKFSNWGEGLYYPSNFVQDYP